MKYLVFDKKKNAWLDLFHTSYNILGPSFRKKKIYLEKKDTKINSVLKLF
jgi:hypothetical protein